MHFAHKEGREATFRAITSFIGAINGTITKYEVRRKISRGSIFILIMPLVHVPVYVCVCVCVCVCSQIFAFWSLFHPFSSPLSSFRFTFPGYAIYTPQWFRRVRDEHSTLFVDLAMMFRSGSQFLPSSFLPSSFSSSLFPLSSRMDVLECSPIMNVTLNVRFCSVLFIHWYPQLSVHLLINCRVQILFLCCIYHYLIMMLMLLLGKVDNI